jgi:hypothetical protein
MFNIKNISRYSMEDYCRVSEENKKLYKKVKATTRETLKTDIDSRIYLLISVPLLRELATGNEEFKKDLEKYLEEINYDEEDIIKERDEELQKLFIKSKEQ